MKHFEKILICVAGGLAVSAGLRADTVPTTGNPYALVVARNIFGLNPPPPPDLNPAPVEAPVKITPNGIMNVFGKLQVLFKVSGKTPGKEESYMLTEGQGQDDIDVIKIDEKNSIVTFNNHGVEQVLPLTAAASSSLPAAAAMGGNSGIPGVPGATMGGTFGSSGFNTAFGSRGGTGLGIPTAANVPGIRPIATRPVVPANQQPAMTPEQQIIMIEAQRMQYQSVGDPVAKILPPTIMTPPSDSGDETPAPAP
jgi:hypothetical protein